MTVSPWPGWDNIHPSKLLPGDRVRFGIGLALGSDLTWVEDTVVKAGDPLITGHRYGTVDSSREPSWWYRKRDRRAEDAARRHSVWPTGVAA